MKKSPEIFIEHILECLNYIEEYTEGITKEDFISSVQLQDAVIRRIEIIGESGRLIPHFNEEYLSLYLPQLAR